MTSPAISAPSTSEKALSRCPARPVAVPETRWLTARGCCRPFGVTPVAGGCNFAVFSRNAERVHLLLFQDGVEEPIADIPFDPAVNKTGDVWHILVHDLPPTILYGYRVHGPSAPRAGHRFDAQAVLLDPYARALSGGREWAVPDRVSNGHPTRGRQRQVRRARLAVDEFDWQDDVPPRTPLAQSIIYELHVRGFTRHGSAGVRHPGTFLGLCEKIPYLKSLGVTAVQLMPVLEFDELDTVHRHPATGELLTNYWGYSPLSFFAPKASYAADPAQVVAEFQQMVKLFHRAGIEVILDVVYNHTSEGNENGPTISFRGLDNAVYYMLERDGQYLNYSGCGNTLNCNQPIVHDLIIESLLYLVAELHVDGFRFDLASILGRGPTGKVLDDPPLLRHIAEHPALAGVKLLAEPWDASGTSHLGKFSAWGRWSELNGDFRDDVRKFLRSEAGATAAIAKRLCGSLDLYPDSLRHPYRSINFVTCHDGFTLNDLVSYNQKHNWANGENNQDGWNHNFSYNCGHEGPSDNAHIQALRQRQLRNFLTLLFISQGVPLLLQGDEFGRSQQGNNNAYCQDNEIAWVDWGLAQKNAGLLRFTRLLIALRKRRFALSQQEFVNRVRWHGTQPDDPDWTGHSRTLAFHVQGQPPIYVMLNAHWEARHFHLPSQCGWRRLVDTNLPSPDDIVEEKDAVPLSPANSYIVSPRSAVILIG